MRSTRTCRLTCLVVLLGCALLLAGCGGVRLGSDDAAGRTVLTTFGFGTEDEIATTRVARFEEAHPDVALRITEGAFDPQQFLSALVAGDPPDLVYLDREEVGSYAARGALEPLTTCIEQQRIDLGQLRPTALEQVRYGDVVYGIPEFHSVRVVLVNDTAADVVGTAPARIPTGDWGALRAWAAKANERSGGTIQRIGFDPKVPEFLPLWARAAGGSVLSDDGLTAQLDSPPVVEALTFTAEVIDEAGGWAAFQAFRDSFDLFGAENQFAADQLGAMPMEDWYLNVLAESSPEAPVTVTGFQDRQGRPLTYASGQAWAVPKGADDPDLACAFMRTMTEVDAWLAAAKARAASRAEEGLPYTGTWTGNAVADERIMTEVYRPSGTAWLDRGVQVVRRLQGEAFALPPTPAGAEVKQAWTDAVNAVLDGSASPRDALARAQESAQRAIDEGRDE